jgi:lantibiotic modifying enzyme
VQHGAAGVLAVLVRASECGAGEPPGEALRDAAARVAGWIDERLMNVPRFLPGLYFGRTGTAWALYDAARLLADDSLASRALMLADATPLRWPCPDVCHGTAGAGFAHLHLWHRTGDAEFGQRVRNCVDAVLEAAVAEDERVCWPIPDSFDTRMAGISDYGFAHGIAGIGAFLLAAGLATGRDDAVKTARLAGDTLLAGAIRHGDAAYWPNRVSGPDPKSDLRYHWCSGASGVGTFLIRLWRATGEPGWLETRSSCLT